MFFSFLFAVKSDVLFLLHRGPPFLCFCVCEVSSGFAFQSTGFFYLQIGPLSCFLGDFGFFLALQFSLGFYFNGIWVLYTLTVACICYSWTCCLVQKFLLFASKSF